MAIHFYTDRGEREIEAGAGRLLAELAQEARLFLNTRCGGEGSCGGCTVALEEGEYRLDGQAVVVRPGESRPALACRTTVTSANARVIVPLPSLIEISGKIADDFCLQDYVHDAQTKKFFLRVPPATLADPGSDRERMERELARQTDLKNIYLPLAAVQKLPRALATGAADPAGAREITVTIGRIRSYWFVIDIEPHHPRHPNLAVAVDIGTTTVVVILIDLTQGTIVARGSRYNQQIIKADDVAARISCCQTPEDVRDLQRLVVAETINPIIEELCRQTGVSPRQINRMAVSGNTVMTHLFLGLSPASIGRVPFQAVTLVPGEYLALDIGVKINPHGIIDMIPSISGYLGGDITADIYVAKILENPELTLLVDIGTNGEIVLAEAGQLSACATAAGPAFEGAGILCGCRAAAGAIERIAFGDTLEFKCSVIGGGKPIGLCGSALIDFLAQGLLAGIITPAGRFDVERLKAKGIYERIVGRAGRESIHACVIVSAATAARERSLVVTEADIAQLLQAKAAVYAGIKTLLSLRRRSCGEIKRFVLAGGFARSIDLANAIRIGLLPEIPLERMEVIGNGSLAGAFLALIEPHALKEFRQIIKRPEVIKLNLTEDFEDNFVDALRLPHLNAEEFPGVMAQLAR